MIGEYMPSCAPWLRQSLTGKRFDNASCMSLPPTVGITLPTQKASLSAVAFPTSRIKEYTTRLKTVYSSSNWPLFAKGDWPPRLSKLYINLKLVKHQRLSKARDEKLLASAMQYGAVQEIHSSIGYLRLDEIFLQDEQMEKQEKMRRDPDFQPFGITSMNLMVHERLNPIREVASNNEPIASEPLGDEGMQASIHKRQEVQLSCQQDAQSIKILADGVPGVGKTTLSRKLCKDWAEGIVYLSGYTLVLFIPLRDDSVGPATELWQLLPHGNKALKQAVADELEYNEGKNTLFIFDGWDELPVEYQKSSFIRKILEGKALIECSVLVTSRPHASTELIRKEIPDRHVEISGLTKEQIRECITERFRGDEDTGKELLSQIEIRRQLMSLCYIPLNLSIVLYVYKSMEILPHTLTEIYEIYIKNVLVRDADLIQLNDLDDLPSDALQTYHTIAKVAFDGLLQNTLEFSSKQLEALGCSHSDSLEALGLMTAYKSHTPSSGVVTKYQFTHLTIQEFLAAEALSREPPEKQEEFVWKYMSDGRFAVMLQFFAGRTKLKQLGGLFKIPCPALDHMRFRIILRLAHESQNVHFFKSFAQTSARNVLEVNCQSWRPYDMQIVASFLLSLDWSRQKLNLSFLITRDYGELSFRHFLHCVNTAMNKRPSQVHITARSNFTLTVAERTRADSVFCDPAIANALSDLQFLTKLVVKRRSSVTKPGNSYSLILSAVSSLPHLSSLELESEVDVSEDDITISSHSLTQLLSTRKTPFSLKMICMKVDNNGIASIAHYICDSKCFLKELHLIKCGIDPSHFFSLLKAVSSNSSLTLLNLSQQPLFFYTSLSNHLPVDHRAPPLLKSMCSLVAGSIMAETLSQMIQRSKTLNILQLSHCRLGPEHTLLLSKAIQQNATVAQLLINGNLMLADAQLHCTIGNLFSKLHVLNISHCGITDEHTTTIGTVLCGNRSLKELYLDDNHITAGGVISLLVGLTQNECLECFSLCCTEDFEDILAHCQGSESSEDEEESLTEEEKELQQASVEVLKSLLESNCHLKRLHLQCTFIHVCDSGLYRIADGMALNSTLVELNVSGFHKRVCPILVAGTDVLLQVLAKNHALTHLSLSGYDMSDFEVMQALITLLDSNTSLTHLDLSYTNLNIEEFGIALSRNLTLTELTHSCQPDILRFYDKANFNRRQKKVPCLNLLVSKLW